MPGAHVVEENFHGVISQGIDVKLMVIALSSAPSMAFEVQVHQHLADIASWFLRDGDRANFLKRQ